MTFEEYNKQMDIYQDKLKSNYDEWIDEVSTYQTKYMEDVINTYEYKDKEIENVIKELLCYAINTSESGNAIEYVDSKELAEKIDKILWEEIGEYLLDYEVYEEDGKYCIDCMFAGNYVPYWDGWND